MVAVIQKYRGTVIEFLGDGIFTVFGAPKDVPDHATLAVKCAVEMQAALKEVNEWNSQNGYPNLEMGVGINTGDVVVGNIGSDKKMKYGCMGSTVNITGRLESLTVGGQVFITDNTRKQIKEELIIVSEGSFLPKGSPNELKYCEIKGIGDIVLTNDMDNIVWQDNTEDKDYQFYLLEEKTVGVTTHKGSITKVSDNNRFALLCTDSELTEKQNIMLKHDERRIYAKVIRKDSDGYVICFTSIQQKD
jgi:adenylate cyclase